MSSYFKKQFIIGLVYLIIFSAIGSGIFFLFIYSPPSCTDGILNQAEEDVDCGGPCQLCIEEISGPRVTWVKLFSVGDGLYDLAAYVENKNLNYGTGSLPYVFNVYDASNNLILEKRGKGYIMPREKKYIVEAVNLGKVPKKVELKFEEAEWQRLGKDGDFTAIEDLNLPVFNARLDLTPKDSYAARVDGTVYNQTKFDLATIDINVAVYDLKGNPIAVNKTQRNTVRSQEGRFFEVVWPALSVSSDKDARIDVQAHTNIFSDSNLTKNFIEE